MKIFNKTFIIYLIIFCSGIFVGTFLGHTVFVRTTAKLLEMKCQNSWEYP